MDISQSITELTDAIGSALTFLLIIGVIGYLLLKRWVEKEEKKQKKPRTVDKLFELRKKLVDDLNNSIKNIVGKKLTDDELFELRKKLVDDLNNSIKNIVGKKLTDDELLKREEELVELESKFRYLEHLNWLKNKNGESEIDKLYKKPNKTNEEIDELRGFYESHGLGDEWINEIMEKTRSDEELFKINDKYLRRQWQELIKKEIERQRFNRENRIINMGRNRFKSLKT